MTPPPGSPPPAPAPVRLIVAAPPSRSGAELFLASAIEESTKGASVSVLFSEGGLDFLAGHWPRDLAAAGVRMTLCSRSARIRGIEPANLPATVMWWSLANFLADAGPDARLWTAFA